jgi:hypothetical protein
VTNILFTPHVPPALHPSAALTEFGDRFRCLDEADPAYWETLRGMPLPLAGLRYPEPTIPPATGSIVLGEIVAAQVEAKRAPRKRTKGPGLAVAR